MCIVGICAHNRSRITCQWYICLEIYTDQTSKIIIQNEKPHSYARTIYNVGCLCGSPNSFSFECVVTKTASILKCHESNAVCNHHLPPTPPPPYKKTAHTHNFAHDQGLWSQNTRAKIVYMPAPTPSASASISRSLETSKQKQK